MRKAIRRMIWQNCSGLPASWRPGNMPNNTWSMAATLPPWQVIVIWCNSSPASRSCGPNWASPRRANWTSLANQASQRAAELASNDPALLVSIGQQYHRLRLPDKASACFERAVAAGSFLGSTPALVWRPGSNESPAGRSVANVSKLVWPITQGWPGALFQGVFIASLGKDGGSGNRFARFAQGQCRIRT